MCAGGRSNWAAWQSASVIGRSVSGVVVGMGGTVRPRSRRRKTRSARIRTPRVMIRSRGRAAPSALLRRGRGGAELLARGRPAAHGRVAGEPGDPAARGRARRRAVRAHDPQRRAHRGGAAAARRRRGARCRRSTPRSPTPRGRGAACSGRCGSAPRRRRATRSARRCSRGCASAHPGIAVDASEATTGNLCRELLSHRLDVALGFCTEPVPGLARRVAACRSGCHVLMRRTHRARRRGSRCRWTRCAGDRFVVPRRRAEHRVQPAPAAAVPPFEPVRRRDGDLGGRGVAAGRRSRHARRRGPVARTRAAAHARRAARARRVDADRAGLARGRRLARAARASSRWLATPSPAPAA